MAIYTETNIYAENTNKITKVVIKYTTNKNEPNFGFLI
jgi:hypothetical protein